MLCTRSEIYSRNLLLFNAYLDLPVMLWASVVLWSISSSSFHRFHMNTHYLSSTSPVISCSTNCQGHSCHFMMHWHLFSGWMKDDLFSGWMQDHSLRPFMMLRSTITEGRIDSSQSFSLALACHRQHSLSHQCRMISWFWMKWNEEQFPHPNSKFSWREQVSWLKSLLFPSFFP